MDSMTDDDASLPIDFNETTRVPRFMDTDMSVNETGVAGKFSEVHTMKEHETHMSELKKENFELKLRIYFLEEKIQHHQVNSDDDDAFKMNIELKVEIEKLKSELNEKRRLLVKASAAVDSLHHHSQEQIKKLREQHNQDIDQVKRSYEPKIEELNELLNTANRQSNNLKNQLSEAERLNRKIKEDVSKPGFSSEEATEMQAKLQARLREKERIIDELKSAVDVKESRVKLLNKSGDAEAKEQIKGLNQNIEERDLLITDLKEKLRKAEMSVKDLRGELHENERKLQLTSQANNSLTQKLNEVNVKQSELDEVQEKFRILQQNLEKAQDIIDEASLKDVEAFEEKSNALKAKDALIAELQGNVKQKEMENDHLTRSIGRKDVELQKVNEVKSTQEAAEKKHQEKEKELAGLVEQLTSARNKLREATDKHEERLQKISLDHQNQLQAKDQVIHRVTETLEEKESIIQDLLVTQENISQCSSLDDITDTKEELIQKLRDRLKERDAAVEANIEDKFQALHEKEEELQKLRKGLRERDRLIENINAAVLQHEDTVQNLESAVAEKTNLINDLKLSVQNQQNQFQEANEIALKRSRENEGLVEKLKRNLSNREQQIENLKTVLQRNASKEARDVEEYELVNELSNTLKEKEKMLSELLTERSQTTARNEENNQKIMNALVEKENLLKEMSEIKEQVCTEKNAAISRLQQQVNSLNLDVQALENSKLWAEQEHEILLGKVRQSLSEKDRTIEKLISSGKEKDKVFLKLQECATNKTTSPVRLEITNLKNTVQDLQSELQEKQDVIGRLDKVNQENEHKITTGNQFVNLEYTAELELELEQKNFLLKQATEAIEAFQAKLNNLPVLEEMKKNLEETERALRESELERNKLSKDMQNLREQESNKRQSLQNEVTLLKQQRDAWLLQDSSTERQPEDQVKRLRDLLQQQIQETSRLSQMLQKERETYVNIMKRVKTDSGPKSFSRIDGELEVISELRRSLEDGIKQNNKLRAQLHQKLTVSPEPKHPNAETSKLEDVKRLQAKLEDSERWNMSLQSRLDALQPRARGVGGSEGNLTVLGTSSPQSNDAEAAARTKKQLEDLKARLDESEKMNARLREKLENMTNKSEEMLRHNRLNEQQKQEITLLREELQKANNVCGELRTAAKKADAEMSAYKKEHDNEFNSLKRALEDSQRVIESLQERLNEEKEDKRNQTSFVKGVYTEPDGAVDGRSSKSPQRSQVSHLQRELEEMYRTNDELRRTLTGNMQLGELNCQLKGNLLEAQRNNKLLEKQLEKSGKELEEMTSEVSRVGDELDRAHALNLDYASQLKTLRDQGKGLHREDVANAWNENEKLKDEIQRLLSLQDKVRKENERMKGLLAEKDWDQSPDKSTSPLTSTVKNAKDLDSIDAVPNSSFELQALRKKLELSEKLNAALEYELEVNRKSASKPRASGQPLMDHLEELRQLRSRLEESIKTYYALCAQLQEKLSELKESDDEEKALKERLLLVKENESLRSQLTQFTEKMKKIQGQLEEQMIAGRRDKEQLSLVNNRLVESNKANEGLRKELAIYDRVLKLNQSKNDDPDGSRGSTDSNNDAILLLMAEIRSLRKQLEASIQSNNSLRQMLQSQLTSSPQRQTGARSPERGMVTKTSPMLPSVPDRSPVLLGRSSPVSRDGEKEMNVMLESETLEQLRQYVNSSFHNSESLLIKITRLALEGQDKLDDLKKELETLRSLLFKSNKLLDHLWAEQLSSGPTAADHLTKQNEDLQKEITMLKKRVLSQSKILENTATRLESSSRMRKEVERSLFARLSETRDTLGSSRTNLQDRLAARTDTLT